MVPRGRRCPGLQNSLYTRRTPRQPPATPRARLSGKNSLNICLASRRACTRECARTGAERRRGVVGGAGPVPKTTVCLSVSLTSASTRLPRALEPTSDSTSRKLPRTSTASPERPHCLQLEAPSCSSAPWDGGPPTFTACTCAVRCCYRTCAQWGSRIGSAEVQPDCLEIDEIEYY